MNWKLSLPEYQMAIYYLAKLTGMAPFTLKEKIFHPPTLLGVLYIVCLACSYLSFVWLALLSAFEFANRDRWSEFSSTLNILLAFVSSASTLFNPLIALMMRNKFVHLMNKLCFINSELKSLGIMEDHDKFFKNLFVTVVMANTVAVAIIAATNYLELHWPVSYRIKFDIDAWSSFNMVLIFAEILLYIRQRFALLNRNFYDVFVPTRRVAWIDQPRRENQAEFESVTDLERMRKIQFLHFVLRNLVERTTHIFAIPMLLNTLQCFLVLILSSFWIFSVMGKSSQFSNHTERISFVVKNSSAAMFMLIGAIAEVYIIAYASAATCQQGNYTKTVLSKIWINSKPAELKNEFFMFSTQLLHKSVTVSIFGFFNLDYSYACEILGSLVAYLVIIKQFDPILRYLEV